MLSIVFHTHPGFSKDKSASVDSLTLYFTNEIRQYTVFCVCLLSQSLPRIQIMTIVRLHSPMEIHCLRIMLTKMNTGSVDGWCRTILYSVNYVLNKCCLASSQAGNIGWTTRQEVEAGQGEQEYSGKKETHSPHSCPDHRKARYNLSS